MLIPASAELIRADLAGARALARRLGARVPPEWPPPLYDEGALRFALDRLRDGAMDGDWCFHYVVTRAAFADGRGTAVGVGGFKGRPSASGEVEVGYSILPAFQRRGFAREALRAWAAFALGAPDVTVVVAQTLRGLEPSIRVAESVGFRYAGPGHDPGRTPGPEEVLRFELRREGVRNDALRPLNG